MSPRHLSNATNYPITLYGEQFVPGLRLQMGERRVPTRVVDDSHLVADWPSGYPIPAGQSMLSVSVRLLRPDGTPFPGETKVTLVNDEDYPQLSSMVCGPDLEQAFVADTHGDRVWRITFGSVDSFSVGDGPRSLAYQDGRVFVLHEWDPSIWIISAPDGSVDRRIPLDGRPQQMVLDGPRAYVTDRQFQRLLEVDPETGKVTRSVSVGAGPGPVTVSRKGIAVGNGGSADLSWISPGWDTPPRIAPDRSTQIVGGHTEPYQPYIMSGSAARALVSGPDVVFVADVGPVIGPNPDRMEVSMNGGIGVFDPETRRFLRHVSLLRGVPQDLARDPERGLLYVADVATGRVVALDEAQLLGATEAQDAQVAEVEIMPPEGTPYIRREGSFAIQGRSSVAIHSGPSNLCLSADGSAALVLHRFTGAITKLDLTEVRRGRMSATPWSRVPGFDRQARRRAGEVVFYTDLSNRRMTCDACHLAGHASGVLFTKGEPMHIYRTPSLRSIRETPPYFTPALFPSLRDISSFVLTRNRYHNPEAAPRESLALTEYQHTLVQPPNPFRTRDGGFPEWLSLPDDTRGSPAEGLRLFEGKGECVSCHPPPQFSTDALRPGELYDVGTQVTLPLRLQMQDAEAYPLPAPALVGVWDHFPLLHSGGGGYRIAKDGRVLAEQLFALRAVAEQARLSRRHGGFHRLSDPELNHLLAYLMTL